MIVARDSAFYVCLFWCGRKGPGKAAQCRVRRGRQRPGGGRRPVTHHSACPVCRAGASTDAKGFAKADAAKKEARKKDARWELEAADVPEWGQWLSEQREAAGVKSDGVYVQVLHYGKMSGMGHWCWGMPVLGKQCGWTSAATVLMCRCCRAIVIDNARGFPSSRT